MANNTKLTRDNFNPRNPRLKLSKEKAAALTASLKEFGDLGGIVLNRKSKQLVGAHQRIESFLVASKSDSVTVKITDTLKKPDATGTVAFGFVEMNGTRYSYREVEWNKEKEIAGNIAANEHGSEFEWQQLSGLLKEIDGKFDMSLTGFQEHDLENLLKAEWQPAAIEPLNGNESAEKKDTVELTKDTRKALNAMKKKIDEPDDNEAIRKACEHYKTSI